MVASGSRVVTTQQLLAEALRLLPRPLELSPRPTTRVCRTYGLLDRRGGTWAWAAVLWECPEVEKSRQGRKELRADSVIRGFGVALPAPSSCPTSYSRDAFHQLLL